MAHPLTLDTPSLAPTVRAAIARAWLAAVDAPEHVGAVRLFDHQRDAAARLRLLLHQHGGALLADEVGLGKTFTALAAVAAAERLLVVAPAVLLPMWRTALERAELRGDVISHETLSLGKRTIAPGYDAMIVDEAHHARNPATRRYASLADLSRGVRLVLISATPLHNSPDDLRAVLALFLGARAYALDAVRLAAFIVRRRRASTHAAIHLPSAAPVEWLAVRHDETVADALLRIPPAVPPRDGGAAAALVTCSMVRHWASSVAALRGFLRRRLARAGALTEALAGGRHLSAHELDAWTIGDDAVQLAFPELIAAAPDDGPPDPDAMQDAVRAHAAGLRVALDTARCALGDDVDRARRLLELSGRFPDARIVAFAQFAETVTALYRLVRPAGGVAALTASGAAVAGGRISRSEVLARFAPRAHGVAARGAAERIGVLLTTDLLSEGVNLQDAEIVVHLDLPWTPARIEQRLGRIRRIGSTHDVVRSFAIAPPLGAERAIGLVRRLLEKAGHATATVGTRPPGLPTFGPTIETRRPPAAPEDGPVAPVECLEQMRELLRGWLPESIAAAGTGRPVGTGTAISVAAVEAARAGWLALVASAEGPRLLASDDARTVSDAPCVVFRVAERCCGREAPIPPADTERALDLAERWLAARRGRDAARSAADASPTHRACATRLGALISNAPPHVRPALAARVAALQPRLDAARGIGAERRIEALIASTTDDAAWLAALESSEVLPPSSPANAMHRPRPKIRALLLLIPPTGGL